MISGQEIGFVIPTFMEIALWYMKASIVVILVLVGLRYIFDFLKTRVPVAAEIVKLLTVFLLGAGVLLVMMLASVDSINELVTALAWLAAAFVIPVAASIALYKGLKQKKIVYVILVVVLLSVPVFFAENADELIAAKRVLIPDVPQEVKEQVDAHIASKLGMSYFEENYVYAPQESRKLQTSGYYSVAYNFVPLQKYGGYVIHVKMNNGEIVDGHVLYSCALDPEVCDFRMTEEEFAEIRTQYGLKEITYWNPPTFGYALNSCSDTGSRKNLILNYKTGEYEIRESICVDTADLY